MASTKANSEYNIVRLDQVKVSQYFGCNTFSERTLKERLSKESYKAFKSALRKGERLPDGWWMRPDGRRMTRRDWDNTESRSIGVFLNGEELRTETKEGHEMRDDSFLLLFNGFFEDLTFRLPARRFGARWEVALTTGRFEGDRLVPGADVLVETRSIAVLRRA